MDISVEGSSTGTSHPLKKNKGSDFLAGAYDFPSLRFLSQFIASNMGSLL
jgi:hypothetical protein